MPQAIIKPEDVIRFAHNLKQFNGQLRQSSTQMNGQFKQLGDTWRDQEHQKFAQEFQQTMRVIERFIQTSEQHIPFLIRKAQRAQEYLNQR